MSDYSIKTWTRDPLTRKQHDKVNRKLMTFGRGYQLISKNEPGNIRLVLLRPDDGNNDALWLKPINRQAVTVVDVAIENAQR